MYRLIIIDIAVQLTVILLQPQSDKKEFVKEARERNKTIFRQRKEPAPPDKSSIANKSRVTRNNSLPKLKSLLPDAKRRESKPFTRPVQDNKPRIRQPKKYAHIRSSGYGGFGSTSTLSTSNSKTKDEKATEALPTLRRAKIKNSLSQS